MIAVIGIIGSLPFLTAIQDKNRQSMNAGFGYLHPYPGVSSFFLHYLSDARSSGTCIHPGDPASCRFSSDNTCHL
jgi:hypothetical protein